MWCGVVYSDNSDAEDSHRGGFATPPHSARQRPPRSKPTTPYSTPFASPATSPTHEAVMEAVSTVEQSLLHIGTHASAQSATLQDLQADLQRARSRRKVRDGVYKRSAPVIVALTPPSSPPTLSVVVAVDAGRRNCFARCTCETGPAGFGACGRQGGAADAGSACCRLGGQVQAFGRRTRCRACRAAQCVRRFEGRPQ